MADERRVYGSLPGIFRGSLERGLERGGARLPGVMVERPPESLDADHGNRHGHARIDRRREIGFSSAFRQSHQPDARRIHIGSSDQIVDQPHGVPYRVVHVRMAAACPIGLQQRIRVVGDAVVAVRALSVIARVDRDGHEAAVGQRPQQRHLLFFFCAGSMEDDDGRAAGDFRCWRLAAIGAAHQDAGDALARFGRHAEMFGRIQLGIAPHARLRGERHAGPIDQSQKIGARLG